MFHWVQLSLRKANIAFLAFVSYVLSFSLGAGPVPALLLPEIFASRIRAKAVALSLGMHWVSFIREAIISYFPEDAMPILAFSVFFFISIFFILLCNCIDNFMHLGACMPLYNIIKE